MQERDSRRLIKKKFTNIEYAKRYRTAKPTAGAPADAQPASRHARKVYMQLLQGRNRCTITQRRTCHAQPHHRRVLKSLVRLTCYSIHLHCPLSDDDLSYAQHNLLGCLHLISLENRVIDFGGPTVLGSLGAGLPGPCLERLDHVDVAAR